MKGKISVHVFNNVGEAYYMIMQTTLYNVLLGVLIDMVYMCMYDEIDIRMGGLHVAIRRFLFFDLINFPKLVTTFQREARGRF